MAYIFEDEFTIYNHAAELKISRNSATDMTKIIVTDNTGLSFTFVLKPNRELQRYVLKVEDVNETRRLVNGNWEIVP